MLFGWRGDTEEREKFWESYDGGPNTQIIVVDCNDVGWLTVRRGTDIYLDSIYLAQGMQGAGVGGFLIKNLLDEAQAGNMKVRLSTAKINPARKLYARLGFAVVGEDQYKVYMEYRRPDCEFGS